MGDYWALTKNHRLFAIDGSRMTLPKELLNEGYQKQNHAHYPQGLASCLYQLKSKIPYDFALVPHNDERLVAFEHIQCLREGDLVVYDRGYFSYALLHAHHQKNIYAVFRLASNSCKIINEFMQSNEIDRIVNILPCKKEQMAISKKHSITELVPLQLRLLKYTIDDQTYTLGVTLFDESIYQRQELAELYHSRWGIEELYKISKTLIDVEDFHSKTERGVKQELFAHFVMITLSRIFTNQMDDVLLLEKGNRKSKHTIKTNVKNSLCVLARNLEELFLRQISYVKDSINRIYETISACVQIVRPNRSYKRISNKVPKKW
jgi:Transposase DDE domain